MKVLITGGAGFIGSHLVDNLLARNWQVVVLDNLSTGLREHIAPGVRLIQLDIASDDLLPVFQQEGFDYVVHLAAQSGVPRSLAEPDYDCQVNILGTVRVLDACRKTGVKRVVFASSAAVYGNTEELPIVETCATMPESFYALSKVTGEQYFSMYQQLFGLEYVILRYANVYGPRQGDAGEGGVVSIFTKKIAHDEPLVIFGDGGQTRDFVYVGDVAEANYKALVTPHPNQVYNVSTQVRISVNTVADLLARAAGKTVDKRYAPAREGDIYHSALANRMAVAKLYWQPEVALAEGLTVTYRALTTG